MDVSYKENTKPIDYYPTENNAFVLIWGGNETDVLSDFKINCPCDKCLILFLGHLELAKQKAEYIFHITKETKKKEGDFKENKGDEKS